jgi:hypothetical protein
MFSNLGRQKTRIRDVLRPSRIEGEQELKQIVEGATRTGNNIVDLFQRNFGLDELDASALAGVVLPAKGKYFSSSFFFLTLFGFWIIHFSILPTTSSSTRSIPILFLSTSHFSFIFILSFFWFSLFYLMFGIFTQPGNLIFLCLATFLFLSLKFLTFRSDPKNRSYY